MALNPMEADYSCLTKGCQLRQALVTLGRAAEMQQRAELMVTTARRDNMSRALWCDSGGHAFSERDPGRQRVTVQVLDDDGTEHEDFREFCGECAEKAGLLRKRVTRPQAALPVSDGQPL